MRCPPSCATTLLAAVDAEPAGCVAVVRLDASTAVMKRLYVRPSFRKRGIAASLIAQGVRWARDHGFARVTLDTDKRQLTAAYALYKALGFTECEPYGAVDYPSPTYLELRLRP
jgi:GNAT superfamily N-acetyltransferase